MAKCLNYMAGSIRFNKMQRPTHAACKETLYKDMNMLNQK